jgi:hypothetical protein
MDIIPYSPVPNKCTKSRLVNRVRDTERVQERKRSGRPFVLNDDHAESIRQTLLRSATKLPRRLCNWSRLSYGSVQKAAKFLKLHPYRVHVMYEVKGPDRELRL